MTDTITLRRAVVEKLRASFKVVHGTITETGWALDCREELAVIDAALAEPDATREPANLTQIAESYSSDGSVVPMYWVDGWRAAERFHGIRKEGGK
jgi:hypothetical protein